MTKRIFASVVITATIAVAHGHDYTGNDWVYNFDGHYSIANINNGNLGTLANLLGAAINLTAQLNLINGNTSAVNYGTNISQSSFTAMSVNDLRTTASAGPGLVPSLGNFVFNLLDFSDGIYAGSMSGTNVTLTRGSLINADLFALVDTRIAGTGVVLDLQAAVPTAQLNGTLTGIHAGDVGPFGDKAYFITGQSGLMQTIALNARARVFVAGIAAVDTGYLSVGAIDNFADSWNLARPVPEPATMAAMGIGLIALARKRRRR